MLQMGEGFWDEAVGLECEVAMDWTGCELVEVVPGKVSGVPLVVGTRIPADLILELFDSGRPVEEILEDYPSLSSRVISEIAEFAHTRHGQTAR